LKKGTIRLALAGSSRVKPLATHWKNSSITFSLLGAEMEKAM